jgi:chorismate mutase
MVDAEIQKRVRELRERVEIMDLKAEAGAPIYDPKREEEILRRVVDRNPGPIYDSSMRDIFELILHRIRDLEIQRGEFPR